MIFKLSANFTRPIKSYARSLRENPRRALLFLGAIALGILSFLWAIDKVEAGTASWNEILWTLGALMGLAINVRLLRVAQGDMGRLRRANLNGPRTLVARGNRRNEVVRVLVQLFFLVIGVLAMITPNAVRPDTSLGISLFSLVLSLSALLMEGLMVWGSVRDLQERHKLIELVDAMEREWTGGNT
jgi:hypothetical protein